MALGASAGPEFFISRNCLQQAFRKQLCGFPLDFDIWPRIGLHA